MGAVLVYLLVREFQYFWVYLSGFVSTAVVYLLRFIGDASVYFVRGLPVIVFESFRVGIAKTCSGIDSILLFTGLWLGILAWDWKVLDKERAFWMYLLGVLGVFVLNIFRIFLLILIGAYISEDFALNVFHTNASSFLFIVYFAVFLKLGYGWMRK